MIRVDFVKCQVKFCILLDFLHIILFLTTLASTGGPHEISRRTASAGWTYRAYRKEAKKDRGGGAHAVRDARQLIVDIICLKLKKM